MDHPSSPARFDSLDHAVDSLLDRIKGPLHIGAPLGIGKPHRLLNALYARCAQDPSRPLHLYTALSLNPPVGASDLEKRFLGPFVSRHFGDAGSDNPFPRLAYADAIQRDALPAHISVEEFYLQS
ncbi:MAG: acetyl-CoA hydrolase, partial [Luteimonas sp.]